MISLTAKLASGLAGIGAAFVLLLQPAQDQLAGALVGNHRVEHTLSLYAVMVPDDVPSVPDRDATLRALCGNVSFLLARITGNYECLKSAKIDDVAISGYRKTLVAQLAWMDRYQDQIALPVPRIDLAPLYRWREPNLSPGWIGKGSLTLDASYQDRIRRIREHTRRLADANGSESSEYLNLALASAGLRPDERYHDGIYRVVPVPDKWSAAAFLRGQSDVVHKPARLLDLLTRFPLGWLAGGTLLLCLAAILGAGWMGVFVIVVFQAFLAVGYVAIADVSTLGLNADKAFILLRQFEAGITLRLGNSSIWWWHGHTAAVLVLLGLRVWGMPAVQARVENLLASLLYGIDKRKAIAFIVGWAMLAALSLLAPGSGALVAEIEIFLAAAALGYYLAIHVTAMRSGIFSHALDNRLLWVGFAGCGAIILALQARGDSGHVLLAASLVIWFLALAPASWGLRFAIVLAVAASVYAVTYIDPGALPVSRLDDRIALWHAPLSRGPSDLARLQFLQQLAGQEGFGVGQTPWRGITPISGGGLPQQIQSDYGVSLLGAIFGSTRASFLITAVIALYLCCMVIAMRAACASSSRAVAWFFATFSCLAYAIAMRTLISVAGTSVVTPMTGVNVALMTYGPTATIDEAIVLAVCVSAAFFTKEAPYAIRRNLV